MAKSKMIAKSCPKCYQQVAVATKQCKCGHGFFTTKSRLSSERSIVGSGSGGGGSNSGGEGRRRTGRVRRARPHFYDSQDYQRQKRKVPKRWSVSQGSMDEDDRRRDRSKDSNNKDSATAQRAARRRALKLQTKQESRVPPSVPSPPPHPARVQRCATLLSEINRKMCSVTWSPA